MKRLTLHIGLYAALSGLVPQVRAAAPTDSVCPAVKIQPERLPDLNIPRGSHTTLLVGDEIMVAGGHTSGFVPTATAEFLHLSDTAWRQQPMVYTHDYGLALRLRSGEVLLAGGAAEPLGIGQTFTAERYDPKTRTFDGFGCLDTKRMMPSAALLTDGQVVVSGNWYHGDAIELFDGQKQFVPVKMPSRARARSFIFPIADGDAIILGGIDTKGNPNDFPTVVDCLRGDPYDLPLLSEWQPIRLQGQHTERDGFIGDEAEGDFRYLTVMENRAVDRRIALVRDTAITLLPELGVLPKTGPTGIEICYISSVIVDRETHRGYVVGRDSLSRQYIYSFDYLSPPRDTLYYTDPLPGIGWTTPVLTPHGNLVMVAGAGSDNFAPFGEAYLLPLGRPELLAASDVTSTGRWLWWLIAAIVLLAVALAACRYFVRIRRVATPRPCRGGVPEGRGGDATPDLLPRIETLLVEQQLYLNPDLKLEDIADALGVHRNEVSTAINTQGGNTLPLLVKRYRVEHAQRLLRQNPTEKLSNIYTRSGFKTESSFYRAFRDVTGLSPREWTARL